MLKKFIPEEPDTLSKDEISRLFHKGDFKRARHECKKAEIPLLEFINEITYGVQKLANSHRASIALSFIYDNVELNGIFDIPLLLKSAFDAHDYHGFLKNAYRFEIYNDIEELIKIGIQRTGEKQKIEADAWEIKFMELKKMKR